MKKIISLFLIAMLLCPFALTPISAESGSDDLTQEEAYELTMEAFKRFIIFHDFGKYNRG